VHLFPIPCMPVA